MLGGQARQLPAGEEPKMLGELVSIGGPGYVDPQDFQRPRVPLLKDSKEELSRVQPDDASDLVRAIHRDRSAAGRHVANDHGSFVAKLACNGSGGQATHFGSSFEAGSEHLRSFRFLEGKVIIAFRDGHLDLRIGVWYIPLVSANKSSYASSAVVRRAIAMIEKLGSVVTGVRYFANGEFELSVGNLNDNQEQSEFDRLNAAGLL
jgi:hypothetical protein